MTSHKPSTNEYVPAAKRYIDLAPDEGLADLLKKNMAEVVHFFRSIPLEKQTFRYAPAKWTPKDILLHIADAERVFAYRALTIARGDNLATFPNMDEELFAANTDTAGRTMQDIIEEFTVVRESSVFLFKYLTERQMTATANLFGYSVTPRGFGYILVGHTLHHLGILRERYL